jgi:hypothetical protein
MRCSASLGWTLTGIGVAVVGLAGWLKADNDSVGALLLFGLGAVLWIGGVAVRRSGQDGDRDED